MFSKKFFPSKLFSNSCQIPDVFQSEIIIICVSKPRILALLKRPTLVVYVKELGKKLSFLKHGAGRARDSDFFYNGRMFSLPHFQFKSINISTILTSKLKTCVHFRGFHEHTILAILPLLSTLYPDIFADYFIVRLI